MPKIKCVSCNRWCTIERNTYFCAACGKPLYREDFEELIELDAQMYNELEAGFTPQEIASKYARLWSMPTSFRSSVPKPE